MMGENSTIEWCDHTFNPWIGCAKVAPGCEHCYAESFAKRFGKAIWGPQGTRVKTSVTYWRQPLRWNRESEQRVAMGEGRLKVFCASLADVFEDWKGHVFDNRGCSLLRCDVCGNLHASSDDHGYESCGCGRPLVRMEYLTLADLRRDLFALIDATPHLNWLLLTKRPENVRRMWPGGDEGRESRVESRSDRFRPNVWLLTSVSTQADAARNVPELLKCRDLVPVLGLSCEPLLGSVHLDVIHRDDFSSLDSLGGEISYAGRGLRGGHTVRSASIDWLIVGGESGPHARPMHPDWPRSLRDQCQAAGVPFFFKQWGEWCDNDTAAASANGWQACSADRIHVWPGRDEVSLRIGKKAAGRLLDGREWNEMPEQGE